LNHWPFDFFLASLCAVLALSTFLEVAVAAISSLHPRPFQNCLLKRIYLHADAHLQRQPYFRSAKLIQFNLPRNWYPEQVRYSEAQLLALPKVPTALWVIWLIRIFAIDAFPP